jgi:hypothetical protein
MASKVSQSVRSLPPHQRTPAAVTTCLTAVIDAFVPAQGMIEG